MGGVYFIAFFFAIYAIKTVGASTASVVSVLSILMPIIVASVFWGQHPNTLQAVGIGLALLALSLIGAQKKPKPSAGIIASNSPDETQTLDEAETSNQPSDETAPRAWVIPVVLVLFFLLCGCSRIFQEAFKFVSEPQYKPIFSLAAFTVAGIPSLIFLISKKRWPMPMELVLGTFLGISNILQVHFILLAFDYFAGFIVFPMSSAGGVLLTTAAATGLLGERLTRRTCVGIAISVVALFLLHWLPS